MLLAKSSSLPQIKVNFNKYDQFFSNKNSQAALDEPEPESYEAGHEKTQLTSKTHAHNLDNIDRKSSLRSKVDSYLSDGRKMGILDHTNNETSNRRSLTRISLESMKALKPQAEQQKAYLTKLKTELNQFFQKNQSMQREIKNTTAIHSQVSQKITYYEQLLSRSWLHRYELLSQRQENLVYIRYETDRLRFMQDRLKEINILLKKKVKEAQEQQRVSEHQANTLNEIQGIRQNELDNKEYLLRHYDSFENVKTERLAYQSATAITKMQINEATAILKKRQSSIRIMEPQDYLTEVHETSHSRLVNDLLIEKSCAKMLDSMWTKYSAYYESYEKAEQLIKMYCMDRDMLVQDSYRRSFAVKDDLNLKIGEKEQKLEQLAARNRELRLQYDAMHFDQLAQVQKRVDEIKKQFRTGKVQEKGVKLKEQHLYQKSVHRRLEQAERSKHMLVRLKEWIVKQEKITEGAISKKAPLKQHFTFMITSLLQELKEREPSFNLALTAQPAKKKAEKVNKYGNARRRNDKR